MTSGNAPDDDLPRGTCVEVTVKATNTLGSSEKASNCLMPQDINPSGTAGPITASSPTTITVGGAANLNEFTAGDDLKMVDSQGAAASYLITTDLIETVAGEGGQAVSVEGWGSPRNAILGNSVRASSLNNTGGTITFSLNNKCH